MTRESPPSAVVFAYHQVGVRCLNALLARKVAVSLVVTHRDDRDENIWWESVADLARLAGIPVITPDDPNDPQVVKQVGACRPDFIFSFYYRHMLKAPLLQIPAKGAYNMHGSLLPSYRGRVPVNWALVKGESESGMTLHRMELKPDAGHILGRKAVAILPNDTAKDLFMKLVCAAESLLLKVLPDLLRGAAREQPMDLKQGSYFGGRCPEDGRIDWSRKAWEIHNLIRAVAPPYPGAFTDIGDTRLMILGSYWRGEASTGDTVKMYWQSGRCYADCADGKRIELTRLTVSGHPLDEQGFRGLSKGEFLIEQGKGNAEA
ncbi:MAG: formyltransferase [Gammaproteobacteria bacterium]|nr:formyltransferase [Gammaproteobacteria bacterium]